jgi:hypothetical protein
VSGKAQQSDQPAPSQLLAGPKPLVVAPAVLSLEMGIIPVRLAYRDKRPTEPGWPDLEPTPAQIAAWGCCNLGWKHGKRSRWLVGIDLDCPEAVALQKFYLPESWTSCRASKEASCVFYFAEGVTSKKFTDDTEETVVEIRGESSTGSAHQTMVPPSIHPSGEHIEWSPDRGDSLIEPLSIDGRELVTAACKLTRAVLFARAGLSLDDARAAEAAYKPQRPEPPAARRPPLRSEGDVRERARKYVAKMPAAISGQHGHDDTFRVAIALVRGFQLDDAEALEVLREYSQRCNPPWSEKELAHKIKQAHRSKKTAGYLLGDRR